MSRINRNIMHVAPLEDQGSESKAGFDYQDHCATRLLLEMVANDEITATVCEYHEDVTQLKVNKPPCFYSIKKRESVSNWTLGILKDPIIKLFDKLKYRNVGELAILGHGRPKKGNFSLRELIVLLDYPTADRDTEWEHEIDGFASHIKGKWGKRISLQTIQDGLRQLTIRLDWPHPDAVALANANLVADTIRRVWAVDPTPLVAKKATVRCWKECKPRVLDRKCPYR